MFRSLLVFSFGLGLAWGVVQASEEGRGVLSQRPSAASGGAQVIFSGDFDGTPGLWASGLDGLNLRKVVPISNGVPMGSLSEPSWSPDGQQVAYSAYDGTVWDVWVMRSDGAYPTRLTSGARNNSRPSWSPDASKIVFVSDRDGTKDVWLMNRDGSGQRKVVTSPEQENDPSFSPAGDKIVFSRTTTDAASIMSVRLDGSGLVAVTSGPYKDWEPAWGAPGIVFTSNRDGSGSWKLWKVQPDGSGLSRIGDVAGHDPSWLPDGTILFTDESMVSKALAAVSVLDPTTGVKRVVADVQGYFTPVDIRPGRVPNGINPASRGKIAVAILSSAKLDAPRAVVQSTLTFGRTGSEQTHYACSKTFRDVSGDGRPDFICRFWLRGAGFKADSTYGVLRFDDVNGNPYEGRDAVSIVPTDDPEDLHH